MVICHAGVVEQKMNVDVQKPALENARKGYTYDGKRRLVVYTREMYVIVVFF